MQQPRVPAHAIRSRATRSDAIRSHAIRSHATRSHATRSHATRSDAIRSHAIRRSVGWPIGIAIVVALAACGGDERSPTPVGATESVAGDGSAIDPKIVEQGLDRGAVELFDTADATIAAEARAALLDPAAESARNDVRGGIGLHYAGSLRDAIEFFRPHEGGNGRSCATCHRPEDHFGLTPRTVEARWQRLQERRKTDPGADDPLFRSIDADDFDSDFTTLRTKALVRVTIPLPPNVKRSDDPTATTVSVLRAVPTVINARFTAPFQTDGSQSTLEEQALQAMRHHSQIGFDPPPKTLTRLADFQRNLFSSPRTRRLARALDEGSEPPSSDPPLGAEEQRGRLAFDEFCATCHGGPTQTKNQDGRFLPVFARGPLGSGGEAFVNIFTGTPRPPPPGLPPPAPPTPLFFDGLPSAGLPILPFSVTLPTGVVAATATSDPGRGLVTGDFREFGRFDIPTLFGIAKTAPYFHDNSAADLDEVIAHYQALFRFLAFLDDTGGFFAPPANGQGCAPGTCGFRPIPESEIPALKAYLARLGQ